MKICQGVLLTFPISSIGINVEDTIIVSALGRQSNIFLEKDFSNIGAEGYW